MILYILCRTSSTGTTIIPDISGKHDELLDISTNFWPFCGGVSSQQFYLLYIFGCFHIIHSQTEMYLYDLYLFPLFHHALLGKKQKQKKTETTYTPVNKYSWQEDGSFEDVFLPKQLAMLVYHALPRHWDKSRPLHRTTS